MDVSEKVKERIIIDETKCFLCSPLKGNILVRAKWKNIKKGI